MPAFVTSHRCSGDLAAHRTQAEGISAVQLLGVEPQSMLIKGIFKYLLDIANCCPTQGFPETGLCRNPFVFSLQNRSNPFAAARGGAALFKGVLYI